MYQPTGCREERRGGGYTGGAGGERERAWPGRAIIKRRPWLPRFDTPHNLPVASRLITSFGGCPGGHMRARGHANSARTRNGGVPEDAEENAEENVSPRPPYEITGLPNEPWRRIRRFYDACTWSYMVTNRPGHRLSLICARAAVGRRGAPPPFHVARSQLLSPPPTLSLRPQISPPTIPPPSQISFLTSGPACARLYCV